VGKNKLARWTELAEFDNVIQPEIGDVSAKDHPLKGKWNKKIFKNDNPIIIELGCGKGEYTIGLANKFPGNNFIGIDIKGARMWRGAKTSNEENLVNVAFLRTRIEFINSFFTCDEVDELWITFPDPHPGGRNSNKRLTSPRFLNSYRLFLKNNGLVHLKTDNRELFEYTKKVVMKNELESIIATNDLYSEDLRDDILSIRTHYENLFLDKGLQINYLSFRLEKEKVIEYDLRNKERK
jgi:tRNA (guanine-N7-)-methyltransferase